MAALAAIVAANRLVTVLGAAGIGKTRFGLEAARRLLPGYPDGGWFATGSFDGRVVVREPETGTRTAAGRDSRVIIACRQ